MKEGKEMGRTSNFPLLWKSFAFHLLSAYFLNRFHI